MSNRPKEKRKRAARVLDDEIDVEYTPVGRSPKDLFLQIGVIILVVAFLMTSGLVCIIPDQEQVTTDASQAHQLDEETYQIERYSQAIQKDPTDVNALANLGYYTQNKAMKIAAEAEMVKMQAELDQDGDPAEEETTPRQDPEIQKMTMLATAEGYLRKALEQEPDYGFARQELARNLLLQEKTEEARGFIDESVEVIDPKIESEDEKVANEAKGQKAELLRFSSILAGQDEDLPKAISFLDQAIDLRPGDGELYLQRGQLRLQSGEKDQARDDFEIAVDIGQKTQSPQLAMYGQIFLQQLEQQGQGGNVQIIQGDGTTVELNTED